MATNPNVTAGPLKAPPVGANRAPDVNYGGSAPKRTGLFRKSPIGLLVIALHIGLIYVVAGSLGIVELPGFAKPMEAVFIDAPDEQKSEPVKIMKPDLEQPQVET